jgi:hypothetical protein
MQCHGEVSCEASTHVYSLSLNQLSCRVSELNLSEAYVHVVPHLRHRDLPYRIFSVPLSTYNDFLATDHKFAAMTEWSNKTVSIVEIPREPHEAAARKLGTI